MREVVRKVRGGTMESTALFAEIASRTEDEDAEVSRVASRILSDVRLGGWRAVADYSRRPPPFDAAEPYEITPSQMEESLQQVDPDLRNALERAARNIEDYQRRLLPKSSEWTSPDGGRVGQIIQRLSRVGIYAPGGTAAYPSTVLMTAVPAKVAGVGEVILVTPPGQLNPAVLAAARIARVDRAFAVGGVQAIGALAYGAEPIPAVDKIVGPGNAYVTAAKRLVFGTVGIDSTAGPSEILVIADASARPDWVAADLLSQAEHGIRAGLILLTDSEVAADATIAALTAQIETLPRRDTALQSLRDYGAIVVCRDLQECAALANRIAPEHLEVMTENPRSLLPALHNAGAIFLGYYTPESLGDYMAGPSHVLPTSGTARFFSPLSVEDFVKKSSLLEFDQNGLERLTSDVAIAARAESLEAHARAAEIRRTINA